MQDHRSLGNNMDLFHVQEEAAGSVFWHPQGWKLFKTIEHYITAKLEDNGYEEIRTPQLFRNDLWIASGHWSKFRDNMFVIKSDEDDNYEYGIKPMSCPGHVQVFNQKIRSYKDLPLRLAEYGLCHRNEPSGSLNGLMRVRQFTQDDAHIFCSEDQINSESVKFCELLQQVYEDFGFSQVKVAFSTRPALRAGTDEQWNKAESALREAANMAGLVDIVEQPGEGAFYGPKLEFVLTDSLGREWQCGTLQCDFVLPDRLGASFIAEDGSKNTPVMLHRAILGSFERFIAILLEHHQGILPLQFAPTQLVICAVSDMFLDYAKETVDFLGKPQYNNRVVLDNTSGTVGAKVKKQLNNRVPLIGVVGQREQDNKTVSIRTHNSSEQKVYSWNQALALLI